MQQLPLDPTAPRDTARRKFVVGGAVVVAVVIALVVWAMNRPGATPFYYTPTELLAARSESEVVRVSGKVVDGSIERDGVTSTFLVSDDASEVKVTTDQPLPDTLKDGSEVVALGQLQVRWPGNVFVASQVLAKCPSKFKAKA